MSNRGHMPDLTSGVKQAEQGAAGLMRRVREFIYGTTGKLGWKAWVASALGIVFLLSVTQQLAKLPTSDLTSSGTWVIALAWSIPILMAGLGGIFSERTGIVNIGLEGMLVLGTWFGAFGTILYGPCGAC